MFGVATVAHRDELVFSFDDALREEKTRGELLVVARASHDDGDALALQADLERLFHGELVLEGLAGAVGDVDAIDPAKR